MAIAFGAMGTPVAVSDLGITIGMPAGFSAGDFLFVILTNRSGVTWSTPSGWNRIANLDTGAFNFYWREADGTETDVTFADPGSPNNVIGVAGYLTGVDMAAPEDVVGTLFSSSQDGTIGPITGISPTSDDGIVMVLGYRFDDAGTADVLTGDSLTWVEAVDFGSASGNDAHLFMDYALWSGAAPTISDKTFTITGDALSATQGIIFSLNAEITGTPTTIKGLLLVGVST